MWEINKIHIILVFIIISFSKCTSDGQKKNESEEKTINKIKKESPKNLAIQIMEEIFEEKDCKKCAKIRINYPKIEGVNEDNQELNNFINGLITGNLIYNENVVGEDISQYADAFFDYYKKYKIEEKSAMSEKTWNIIIDIKILYNDNEIITLKSSKTSTENLENPIKSTYVSTINRKDFTLITLEESSIIDNNELSKLLIGHFKAVNNIKDTTKLTDLGYWVDKIDIPELIGIIDDKVLFTFDYNEIGPQELGYTEFLIPMEELKEMIDINKMGIVH